MTQKSDSRQSFLGRNSEQTLASARAAVVGLGGGGSHVCQQLAHLGAGNFLLFDPQRIEDTNLNRLVGATDDDVREHRTKTDIGRRMIKAIRPCANVETYPSHWQERAEVLRRADAIFGCVDSFNERSQLERVARRYLIPYIDIGMDVHRHEDEYHVSGQIAVSMPGGPCLWCMGILREDLLTQEANNYGAAGARQQVVWTNGVLASTAVGAFVQLLTPWAKAKPPALLEYDANRGTVVASNKLAVMRETCLHFSSPVDFGDPFWSINQLDRIVK